MRVLVIDDSRSSATAIAQHVAGIAGLTASICLDPVEALAQCETTEFDLVLVDYVMPKLDGIELLTALRTLDSYRLVPMIMIASTLDVEVKRRAIQAAYQTKRKARSGEAPSTAAASRSRGSIERATASTLRTTKG